MATTKRTSIPGRRRQPEIGSQIASLSHEAIARHAFELFVQRGRVHGQALDDWLRAERELRAVQQGTAAKQPRASSKRSPVRS
jgi:hypothetical protein